MTWLLSQVVGNKTLSIKSRVNNEFLKPDASAIRRVSRWNASAKSRKSRPFFEASLQPPGHTSREISGFTASVGFIPAGQHLTATIANQLSYFT